MADAFRLESDQIRGHVLRIAEQIRADFTHGELCVVAVLRGGLMFSADLVRALFPLRLTFEVYPSGSLNLHGKRVLFVDDILDSGRTAKMLIEFARDSGAEDVTLCFLLQRAGAPLLAARTYVGTIIESDEWVMGYGMDDGSGEHGRELPYITATARQPQERQGV